MPTLKAAILPVTPFQQNCSIVLDPASKSGVVVDPGGDVARILSAIEEVGARIETILLTHGHIDHAGGAAELAERLSTPERRVPVVGPHKADKFLLDKLPQSGREYGMADARIVTPDRWLEEGDTVEIGGVPFDVYHCPGHSPGSVVMVNVEQGFALVGDVLFRGSIGRTDFPYGDHEALIRSITGKLLPLGDRIAFICGHGPMSTFGQERQTNPFLNE